MLIYIQVSNCSDRELAVFYPLVYTCVLYLQLLGKTLNQYQACFSPKLQLVMHCYTAFVYEPIFKLYIYTKTQPYIFPVVGLLSLQVTGIEKPNYKESKEGCDSHACDVTSC